MKKLLIITLTLFSLSIQAQTVDTIRIKAVGISQSQLNDSTAAVREGIPINNNQLVNGAGYLDNEISNDPNAAGDSSKLITDWAAKKLTVDTSLYTIQHSVLIPDTFAFKPPFTMYWDGTKTTYNYDIDAANASLISRFSKYYCDPTNGNDANNGLTSSAPKKSLYNLIMNISGSKVIYVLAGNHDRINHKLYNISRTKLDSTIIIGVGDVTLNNYFSTDDYSFSNYSGDAYVATNSIFGSTSDSVGTVVDYAVLDSLGIPTRYKRMATISGCVDSAGTYYSTAGTVYIHAIDNRAIDTSIRISNATILNFRFTTDSAFLSISNINFEGGGVGFFDRNHAILNAFDVRLKDCSVGFVPYQPGSVVINQYGIFASEIRSIYAQNCRAFSGEGDGFHYENSANTANTAAGQRTKVLELDCTAFDWGNVDQGFFPSPRDASNGSSSHGNTNIYRVNGSYFLNRGQQVSDVGESQDFLVGCNVGRSTAPDVDTSQGRQCGFGVNDGQMYLLNCISYGGNKYSAYSHSLTEGLFTDGQFIISRSKFDGGISGDNIVYTYDYKSLAQPNPSTSSIPNTDTSSVVIALGGNSTQWNEAYSWGNHAGLYVAQAKISDWHGITDNTAKMVYGSTNGPSGATSFAGFSFGGPIAGYLSNIALRNSNFYFQSQEAGTWGSWLQVEDRTHAAATYAAKTTAPIITTGTSAPATTPGKAGDIYVDITNKKLYFAAGNSSSSDWIIAN